MAGSSTYAPGWQPGGSLGFFAQNNAAHLRFTLIHEMLHLLMPGSRRDAHLRMAEALGISTKGRSDADASDLVLEYFKNGCKQ